MFLDACHQAVVYWKQYVTVMFVSNTTHPQVVLKEVFAPKFAFTTLKYFEIVKKSSKKFNLHILRYFEVTPTYSRPNCSITEACNKGVQWKW